MKKILLSLILSSFIIGCGSEKNSEKNMLKITIPKDIGELNPHLMASPHYAQGWVYEGLVTLKDGEIAPVLSEKWEISEDGKEYTFKLRENVKFSDGSNFNSSIVKKNFEEVLMNKKAFSFLQSLKEIEKIEIIDDYTIKFVLKNPCNSFLKDLTFSRPLVFLGEKGFVDGQLSAKEISAPIGTGMWSLDKYEANQFAIFKRNENYWGDKPKFEYFKTYVVSDMGTSVAMLRAGDIDMIYDNFDSLNVENIEQLKKEGFNVKISEPKQVTSLSLNTAGKILGDKRVRQALNYATDNQTISKEIFKGIRKPADCYFTDDVEYVKNTVKNSYVFNLDKANELLEESGWKYDNSGEYRQKNGEILEIKLSLDNSIKNGKILAEILQQQYKKVGVKLNISQEESKLFRQNWTKGDFDIIMFNSWGGSYEPFATLAAMISDGDKFNIVQKGIENREELHQVMRDSLMETNKDKLQSNFDYIVESFYEQAIYVPLVTTVVVAVSREDIEGVEFSSIKEIIPLQNVRRK
ncbi:MULTISPECIES: nickel ABC transporter substrate-binding protein [unclassified Fusobacterium]|uniref:nickel ABC transporter substrate-binding protein n=1 Tax=unclassified Fusobacterium TaxID=2648384 RepID=UPI0026315A98|nr:nickel ABC transporter substrate-binding protein [Fusobacterium sp.]